MTAATVDVLTAEVRTLMVGSRQVTLSVFRQLDRVVPSQIDAFGRVNSGAKGLGQSVELVGAHRETGALVSALADPPETCVYLDTPVRVAYLADPDLYLHDSWEVSTHIDFGDGVGRKVAVYASKDAPTVTSPWEWRKAELVDIRSAYRGERREDLLVHWHSELEAELHEGLDEVRARAEEWDRLRALPLIVLAGLR